MVEYSGLTPNEIAKIMNGKPTITLSDTKDSHMGTETFEDESQVVIENPCNKTMPPGITNSVEPTAISRIYNENTEVTVEPQTVTEIIHDEPILLDSNSLINSTEIVSDNTEAVLEPQNIDKIAEDEESDSSGDFVEVSDTKPKAENAFEIVVKPEDELEDDLFSDVFKRVEDTAKTNPKKPNLTKIRELINVEEKTVAVHAETELKNVTEEITRDVVESQPEKDVSPISREQLQEIQQELQLENAEMVKEQLTKERMANSLSEQIVLETQDLLRLFGIPYVVAPMEAEAQCAFLEIINLTDGTITDDSDIWLFGGKTVYKNFFNQQKQVLEYRAEKIQEHYKLSREQMILLALLVGSDYTLGLQGIGPVTALEILGSFPSSLKQVQTAPNYRQLVSGLIDFRQWLNGKRTVGLGRQGLRSKLKNVSISDTFPNLDVVRAYLEPNVDLSKEPFSWGKPNIEGLIDYAKRKFGWSRDKSEGILKPVLKSIQPEVQKSIKHYFKTKHKIQGTDVENKMSKRVKKAVETIEKGVSEDDVDSKKKTAKRRTRKKKEEIPRELSSDEDVKVLRKSQKQTETKLNQIQKEVVKKLDAVKKVPTIATLHKKEVIPQKQKDKEDAFKNKIKAIETFRKSKQGPGFVKSRKRQVRAPKAEAELSESSSD
ncbi:hypothetical protein FQR65_LT01258 [Abscondita terminalis]|nr:hypothetical protein FQR65_LT01258 [Abscondita terminalis]